MLESVVNQQRAALGLPNEVDLTQYPSIYAAFEDSIKRFADKPAYTSLGKTITFAELNQYVEQFASYLQNHTDLKPGDRVAVQLPNIIQNPVVVYGIFKAGLVLVNTNPLYTERELEHQFSDSGAKALVVASVVASTVAKVLPKTDIKHVIVTDLADLHSPLKRYLLNFAIKHIKKMVPTYHIPGAIKFNDALKLGAKKPASIYESKLEDLAVLQYTGGTTGVAKGAILTNGNLMANALQGLPVFKTYGFGEGCETIIQPLPLYHIYAYTVGMLMLLTGNHMVLIPNPRDIPGLVKELSNWKLTGFCGLNTLFVALCNNADFRKLDFSSMKMTLSGGMALTLDAEKHWHEVTGVHIFEGYGLTETSPVVSLNPGNGNQVGTIGLPMPSTQVRIVKETGEDAAVGEPGELWIKGPQVMEGYWQRPEATEEVMHDDWFASGDIAIINEDGYLKIVDRLKDMIVVSGFNVFPNEVEEILYQHENILECAVVGLPDETSGEIVKAFIVSNKVDLSKQDIIDYARKYLTAYKIPKVIEFRDELPKTNVGKILRRALRDEQ